MRQTVAFPLGDAADSSLTFLPIFCFARDGDYDEWPPGSRASKTSIVSEPLLPPRPCCPAFRPSSDRNFRQTPLPNGNAIRQDDSALKTGLFDLSVYEDAEKSIQSHKSICVQLANPSRRFTAPECPILSLIESTKLLIAFKLIVDKS